MTTTKNEATANLKAELAEAEAALDRIYAWLDEADITEAEEAEAMRDLKLVAKRRDLIRAVLAMSQNRP